MYRFRYYVSGGTHDRHHSKIIPIDFLKFLTPFRVAQLMAGSTLVQCPSQDSADSDPMM